MVASSGVLATEKQRERTLALPVMIDGLYALENGILSKVRGIGTGSTMVRDFHVVPDLNILIRS